MRAIPAGWQSTPVDTATPWGTEVLSAAQTTEVLPLANWNPGSLWADSTDPTAGCWAGMAGLFPSTASLITASSKYSGFPSSPYPTVCPCKQLSILSLYPKHLLTKQNKVAHPLTHCPSIPCLENPRVPSKICSWQRSHCTVHSTTQRLSQNKDSFSLFIKKKIRLKILLGEG